MSELPTSGLIGADRSRELLREVAALRRLARRPAGLWPPLMVFGAAAVLGAPLGLIGETATSIWWLAVSVPAFVVVGRLAGRQSRAQGVDRPSRRLWMLAVATYAAGWAGCAALAAAAHLPDGLGWAVLVALGYLVWSRLARSIPAAVVGGLLLAVGAALAWSPAPPWTIQLGVGLAMVVAGLSLRTWWETP